MVWQPRDLAARSWAKQGVGGLGEFDPSNLKTTAFLKSDDKVLVCTHATFRFAVDRFGVEAFDNRLIAIDELEALIHRVFEQARLDIEVPDRFGTIVRPQEWFLVPLFAIDEAIERIRAGTIGDFVYDLTSARLVLRDIQAATEF